MTQWLAHLPTLHSQKRASRSKSAITKPISGCVHIACSGLMITSLLQVLNRLAASCELHAGLMQIVSSTCSNETTCSKSANIKLQQVVFTDLMQLDEVNRRDITCWQLASAGKISG